MTERYRRAPSRVATRGRVASRTRASVKHDRATLVLVSVGGLMLGALSEHSVRWAIGRTPDLFIAVMLIAVGVLVVSVRRHSILPAILLATVAGYCVSHIGSLYSLQIGRPNQIRLSEVEASSIDQCPAAT
jgi:hypothetical protein